MEREVNKLLSSDHAKRSSGTGGERRLSAQAVAQALACEGGAALAVRAAEARLEDAAKPKGEAPCEPLLPPDSEASDGGAPKREVARRPTWRAPRRLRSVVLSPWFGHGSTLLVLINMGIMCAPYAGQSDAYADGLELAATVISLCFMVEMGFKLLVLGCAGYWADQWNCERATAAPRPQARAISDILMRTP